MVVHSVRTEVAEVAKPQCSTERPDARSQECAFDADWSRADCPQVVSGQTAKAVAEAAGVCPHTVLRWVDRYRREGLAGLRDRSSDPVGLTDRPRKPHRYNRYYGANATSNLNSLAPCLRYKRRQPCEDLPEAHFTAPQSRPWNGCMPS